MNRRLVCLLLAASPLLACGGGGGDAPAKAPSSPNAPFGGEPSTVEEAQDQIARAKAELGELQSGGQKDDRPKTEPAPAPPPPPPSPPSKREPGVSEEPGGGGAQSGCASSCRALASMRRAVDALCRMTGDTDARCTGARQTLDESKARVSTCRC